MENKREFIYDFLRVIACLFIVLIHCSERFLHSNGYNFIFWEYNVSSALAWSGLSLFFFISGALLLNKKIEKISHFYLKRFIKILIPFFFYSFLFIFIDKYNCNLEFWLPHNFFASFFQIIREPAYYHLWFVYSIIGIYLFTPFLVKMVQNLKDNELFYLFILIYIVAFIKYFLPSCGIFINVNNLLIIDWLIPFLLGYLSTKTIVNKHYKIIYALGIISFLFYIFALRFLPNFQNLKACSPTMQFETQAIFLFFVRNQNKICSCLNLNKVVSFISLYTYEIYLLHAKVLDILQIHLFYNVIIINHYITMLIVAFSTFIVSFIIALIINTIFIKNIINLIYFILKKFFNISNI